MFGPDAGSLVDFANHFKDRLSTPCDEAYGWACNHTWDDWVEAPYEYAYQAILEFADVISPTFRAMIILRLGDDPFWAARAWMTVPGLTPEEYGYLWAKGYPKRAFAERVLNGSLTPGSRAMVSTAAPGGAAP
jgi:hypothetical protein